MLTLAHIMLEGHPVLRAQPHVSKLWRHHPKAMARKIKLQLALRTLILAKHHAVEVNENQQRTNWKLRNHLVDAVDLLDLASQVLEQFVLGRAFWTEGQPFADGAKGENLDFPQG